MHKIAESETISLYDLFNIVKNTPFCVADQAANGKIYDSVYLVQNGLPNNISYSVVWVLDGTIYEESLSGTHPVHTDWIIDWFEPNEELSQTSSGLCTCDMHSVLMVSGCRCGGK